MHYSKSASGFYDAAAHGDSMPEDVVEITNEDYAALLAGRTARNIISVDADGKPILVDLPPPLVTTEGLCTEIDEAADAARVAVVGAPLRDEEYKLAAAEAKAFKDAGYPAANIPRTVSAWAINGRTAQQAADNILLEAAQYNEALYRIRENRLQAKELVRQAMAANQVEQAQDIAAETIAAIKGAVAGIGNNAS